MKRTIQLSLLCGALFYALPAFADVAPSPNDPNCKEADAHCETDDGDAGTCASNGRGGLTCEPQDPNLVTMPRGGCNASGPFGQGAILVAMAGAGLLFGRRRA